MKTTHYEIAGQGLIIAVACFFIWVFLADPLYVTKAGLKTQGEIKAGQSVIVEYWGGKKLWAQKFCVPAAASINIRDAAMLDYLVPVSKVGTNDGSQTHFVYSIELPARMQAGAAIIQMSVRYSCFAFISKTYFTPQIKVIVSNSGIEGGASE